MYSKFDLVCRGDYATVKGLQFEMESFIEVFTVKNIMEYNMVQRFQMSPSFSDSMQPEDDLQQQVCTSRSDNVVNKRSSRFR